MATIKLIRVDFRLIHGQVIGRWLQQTGAGRILIINDALAKDDFMASIYTMAAPPGISVEIKTVEEAVSDWNSNQLGEGNIFILFKDVPSLYAAFKLGFPMETVQIGGLGSEPDRINVFGPITLNQTDADLLKEIASADNRIYFHQVPDEPSAELDRILKKHSF